jgi:hypothetical protein
MAGEAFHHHTHKDAVCAFFATADASAALFQCFELLLCT